MVTGLELSTSQIALLAHSVCFCAIHTIHKTTSNLHLQYWLLNFANIVKRTPTASFAIAMQRTKSFTQQVSIQPHLNMPLTISPSLFDKCYCIRLIPNSCCIINQFCPICPFKERIKLRSSLGKPMSHTWVIIGFYVFPVVI